MIRKKWLAALVASSVLSLSAYAIDDTALDAAAQEYKTLLKNSREAGDRPGQADMGDFVDKALEKFNLKELTLEQIATLTETLPLMFSPKTAPALDAQLTTLAEAKDASGAQAAVLRLKLLDARLDPAKRAERIGQVLDHPGISEAFSSGAAEEVLTQTAQLGPDGLKAVQPKLLAQKDSIRASAPVSFINAGSRLMLSVGRNLKPEDVKTFSPLREALASAGQEKLGGQVSEVEKKNLEESLARINGAYARGELLNHPAPTIDFLWYKDPAAADAAPKTLADFKGKVVVLDFWATWCGPCIASFPKVKALSRYYRGYDVVVIGVTSPQGFVVSKGSRQDTGGDVQKEIALTQEFLTEKEVSWPTAISKQSVFNPDFGITGIPSVAIIDANGVVRHAGLHPGSPLEEKTALIDKLLSEAKLPLPATMLIPKPKPKDGAQ